ncbi:unnamed protein product [Cylicocyclus nassatus]|uniref:Uncharacterized protein n=1 Tax=Cylicocyclus nassatus TaxID=53992 RepID=A0AA36GD97_CYLNA|nr:unnamed protein product [Cylicocyclus nassatus]
MFQESLLPESPHWLIQQENYQQIEEYIKTSNRWNKAEIDVSACKKIDTPPTQKNETLTAVARSPEMLKLLAINGFLQFTLAFYGFGLTFLSVDLSADRFTAYILTALAELPGGLMVIPLMTYAGRRILCMSTMAIQGIAIFLAPLSREPKWALVSFVLFGKMVNSITYSVHPIFFSEMSPTSVRSLFYSLINIPQSIGIIVAPYLRHIDFGPECSRYDRPLPSDIKTASDNFTEDLRNREMLIREQGLDEDTPPLLQED